MKNYTLNLNERQAQVVAAALDLYARIGIGQFEEVLQVYDPGAKLDIKTRGRIGSGLRIAKEEAGNPANGSHSIVNPVVEDQFRVAYDVRQVIRHKLALDRKPEGGMGVDFDTPHQTGKEPLAAIKAAE
jgi:hypothetical protein